MRLLLILASLALLGGGAWAQASGDLLKQGQEVFEDNCAQCHRANGEGLPATFPALNKNPFVLGDPKPVIATVLNGRKGNLGQMPTWKDKLDDQTNRRGGYLYPPGLVQPGRRRHPGHGGGHERQVISLFYPVTSAQTSSFRSVGAVRPPNVTD